MQDIHKIHKFSLKYNSNIFINMKVNLCKKSSTKCLFTRNSQIQAKWTP